VGRDDATGLDGLRSRAGLECAGAALPAMPRPVRAARLLRDGSSVEFSAVKGRLVLKLPDPQPEEVDRVVVLELEAAK